jgi:hypothetical protein
MLEQASQINSMVKENFQLYTSLFISVLLSVSAFNFATFNHRFQITGTKDQNLYQSRPLNLSVNIG